MTAKHHTIIGNKEAVRSTAPAGLTGLYALRVRMARERLENVWSGAGDKSAAADKERTCAC